MQKGRFTAGKEALSRMLQQHRDSANGAVRRDPMMVLVVAVAGAYILITTIAAVIIVLHIHDASAIP